MAKRAVVINMSWLTTGRMVWLIYLEKQSWWFFMILSMHDTWEPKPFIFWCYKPVFLVKQLLVL